MNNERSRPAQKLTEHWTWTRRLAGHLVGDPSLADDVAQDAWVRASRHPDVAPSRGFLGSIVRNLVRERARGDRHRGDRERDSASNRTSPAPDEILAAAETGQALVAAVLELPEPLRDALLMRYFEDLSTVEIAKTLGEPEGTIRSRIKRGLDALRAKFEGQDGRSRLLALAGAPGAVGLQVAGASTWTVLRILSVGTVAAATVAGIVLATVSTQKGTDTAVTAIARVDAADETTDPDDLARLESATVRNAVASPEDAIEVAPIPSAILTGKLVDEWHVPIEGASVSLDVVAESGTKAQLEASTDADGIFHLETFVKPGSASVLKIDAGIYREDWHAHFDMSGVGASRPLEPGMRDLGEIVRPPRGAIQVHVVDSRGDPTRNVMVVAVTESTALVSVAHTDKNGVALLARLGPGHVLIRPGMGHWDEVPGQTNARIQVAMGQTIEGPTFVFVGGEETIVEDFEVSDHNEIYVLADVTALPRIRGRIVQAGVGVPGVTVLVGRVKGRDGDGKTLWFHRESVDADLDAVSTFDNSRHVNAHVKTDADGRFELEIDSPVQAHELIAITDTHHVRVLPVWTERKLTDLGDLPLVPYAHVTLRIHAPAGLDGWEFVCIPGAVHAKTPYASDADGLLRLPPMPAGVQTFSLGYDNDRLAPGASVRVDLQPGESRTIDIDASAFGMCRVTIRPAVGSEPFPPGHVTFAPPGVRVPAFRVSSHREIESVRWSRSDEPEKIAIILAFGPAHVGYIDRLRRSISLGAQPIELRSGEDVEVVLDLDRTASLDLLIPRESIPRESGLVSILCAGGTTPIPVVDGRIDASLIWAVERVDAGHLRLRGLTAGETEVRVLITDTSPSGRQPVAPGTTPAPFPTTSLNGTVTLSAGATATLKFAVDR